MACPPQIEMYNNHYHESLLSLSTGASDGLWVLPSLWGVRGTVGTDLSLLEESARGPLPLDVAPAQQHEDRQASEEHR